MSKQQKRRKGSDNDLDKVEKTQTVHHKKQRASTGGNVKELNLTSMLDVTFQLLIFFVLTASFAVGEGLLPATLPAGSGVADPAEAPQQPVNITLLSRGLGEVTISVEGAPAMGNFSELYAWLNTQHVRRGGYIEEDTPIIIKPDAEVPWDHVVNAFNAAVRAKFTNVNFAQAS
jgi:biopolymer transport protein ExbD